MLKFLKKYKFNILFFLVFTALLFLFVPKQSEYYWQSEIDEFKNKYYLKFSIIFSIGIILITVILNIIKKKSLKNNLNSTFAVLILCCWFFFFFQSILISLILFVNRSYENQIIDRKFEVIRIDENKYIFAKEINNDDFILNQTEYEKHPNYKNINKLVKGEVIQLHFKKGLFGINYFEQ